MTMKRKVVWLVVGCLMALSLVAVSCGQQEAEVTKGPGITVTEEEQEKEVVKEEEQEQEVEEGVVVDPDQPRYGGTLVLPANTNVTWFDPQDWVGGGMSFDLTMQRLWDGDWAKGNAGGYGTGESDFRSSYDVRDHKRGFIAENIEFIVDDANDEGKIIYTIRQGVHWAINDDSAGARIANGREVTADDVVFSLMRATRRTDSMIYRANPALRTAIIEKTGPWEVTVTVPVSRVLEAAKRFGDSTFPVPQDVVEELGDLRDWQNAVGTGPYILKDYVADGSARLVRNDNYWLKNPVGPGKGDQLPYIDEVRWLIIPDVSTRLAAVRTGKIDAIFDVGFDDAKQLASTAPPELIQVSQDFAAVSPMYIVSNNPELPFYDVRVRRAMMMSIDFATIESTLYDNMGNIQTWPWDNYPAYSGLYLGLDDSDTPESIKALYSYNPEKAKELLADAGYPDGFKTEIVINTGAPNNEADYYSIIKDYFAAVGIDMELRSIENSQHLTMRNARKQETLITSATGPPSIWPMLIVITGTAWQNAALLDDPIINAAAISIGKRAITDPAGAMDETRELMKHVLDQAYVINAPSFPRSLFYWPWLKNYSGERSMGYFWVHSWPQYIWIDQDMKASMGY